MVAAQPEGPLTQAGNELAAGPYVLYYRPIQPGLIEIVRVLHERTELS
jgi:plasmid stabilization system protein ParE